MTKKKVRMQMQIEFINYVKNCIERNFKLELEGGELTENVMAFGLDRNIPKKMHINILEVMRDLGCKLLEEQFNPCDNKIYIAFSV